MKKRTGRQAFTLIELLVVVAIIGILAAILIPSFVQARRDAQIGKILADLKIISTETTAYIVGGNGTVPAINSGGPVLIYLDDQIKISGFQASRNDYVEYGGSRPEFYIYRIFRSDQPALTDRIEGKMVVFFYSMDVLASVRARAEKLWPVVPHDSDPTRLIMTLATVPY